MSKYTEQAERFLADHGLKMRITRSDSKPPPWEPAGHHYRVTLSRKGGGRITFDFFGSIHDMQNSIDPTAYDILACISMDIHCPEDFDDYCAEYGDDPDSIKALQTFKRADRFARKLRAFFAEESEREALAEIN